MNNCEKVKKQEIEKDLSPKGNGQERDGSLAVR